MVSSYISVSYDSKTGVVFQFRVCGILEILNENKILKRTRPYLLFILGAVLAPVS